jgi:toxin-antitoxin system PIN domain toxin
VTIVDVNLLLYAYQADSPQHQGAASWLQALFTGEEIIGLSWITLWAFVRISTNPRAWPSPIPVTVVFKIIRDWLAQPGFLIIHPGPRHAALLEQLVTEARAAGPLVSDAALAALAIENGAVLASTDRDFSRFTNLRWVNPIP